MKLDEGTTSSAWHDHEAGSAEAAETEKDEGDGYRSGATEDVADAKAR